MNWNRKFKIPQNRVNKVRDAEFLQRDIMQLCSSFQNFGILEIK